MLLLAIYNPNPISSKECVVNFENSFWKPILFLVKGSKPNVAGDYFIHDMIESKPHDKTLNDWAQNTVESEYLISKLTLENQIVFDPLMGTGTTGIALLN